MLIEQEVFFEGLDFEPIEFEYGFGKKTCYKGPDGGFYRIDDVAAIDYMTGKVLEGYLPPKAFSTFGIGGVCNVS